jgi:acetyltransferase-like isoleucine patch superfamily enzyme
MIGYHTVVNLLSNPTDEISNDYIYLQSWLAGFWGTFWLRIKAYIFGVKIGENVKCYGTIHLLRQRGSEIVIGNNVTFVSCTKRATATSIFAPVKLRTFSAGAKIVIGDNVGLNGTSIAVRSTSVEIGAGTMIAPNVAILDFDGHVLWPPENRLANRGVENDAKVVIGKNVWLGTQSMVLKGVKIGDNSVVAAGSMVTADIPENVLAGGVPAKVIRKLDQEGR